MNKKFYMITNLFKIGVKKKDQENIDWGWHISEENGAWNRTCYRRGTRHKYFHANHADVQFSKALKKKSEYIY